MCQGGEGVQDAKDLREFHTFQLLLTPEQIVKMNEWEIIALDSSKSRAKAIKDRTIADTEDNKQKDDSKASRNIYAAPVAPPVKAATTNNVAKTHLMSSPSKTSSANDLADEDQLQCDTGLLSFFSVNAM